MPKSTAQKVESAIFHMKAYIKAYDAEARKLLEQTTEKPPEPQEPVQYTRNETVNQAVFKASRWLSTGLTLFSSGASYVATNVIHDAKLTTERHQLVETCLTELEQAVDFDDEQKLDRIKALLADNMAASHKYGNDIHSGGLHASLCQALELSRADASKLCVAIKSPEQEANASTTSASSANSTTSAASF